jgi:2-deoxy-D-gluconate 3-dehydrogenase
MAELAKSFDLSGRVAVVTGGGGLLGGEFCGALAAAGAAVLVVDVDSAKAEAAAARITAAGGQALARPTDITQPDEVAAMAAAAIEQLGGFDILVNSAALDPKMDKGQREQHSSAFEDYDFGAWQRSLDVNLSGAFLCAQAAVRHMLGQGRGVIINICSTYGLVGPDQRIYQREGQPPTFKPVDYTVTKAGILGLTKYLATAYGARGIRCNALSPGGVQHEQDQQFVQAYSARTVLGRMAQPHELNAALLFLASDASSYMTGANLVVDGGWTAW